MTDKRTAAAAETATESADDLALAGRAGRGDHAAFEELARRHVPALFAMARSLAGQHGDAEDLVQETLVAALGGLGRFEGRSSLRTWLVSILVRQASRQRRRWRGGTLPLASAGQQAAARPIDADARMDIARAMELLAPEHREVIVLREVAGLSYQQIADALRLPRGTVESRLHRARLAMREHLADYGP